MELLPHSSDRFVTDIANISYDPKAVPSVEFRQFVYQSLERNLYTINLVRSMFFRAMRSDPKYQTDYALTGPPGASKSTWIAILQSLCHCKLKSFEIRDLLNGFNRYEIKNLDVLVFNEVSGISETDEKFIK